MNVELCEDPEMRQRLLELKNRTEQIGVFTRATSNSRRIAGARSGSSYGRRYSLLIPAILVTIRCVRSQMSLEAVRANGMNASCASIHLTQQ